MHIYSFKTQKQRIPIAYGTDTESRAYLAVWDEDMSYAQYPYAIETITSTISLLGNNWVS